MFPGEIPCRNPNLKSPRIHPLLYYVWSFCAKIDIFPKHFSVTLVETIAVKHKAILNVNISIRIYRAWNKQMERLYGWYSLPKAHLESFSWLQFVHLKMREVEWINDI